MKLKPPQKLESYRYDKLAKIRARMPNYMIRLFFVLSLAGLGIGGFYYKNGVITIISFLCLFPLFFLYIRFFLDKRKIRCRLCKGTLSAVEVKWRTEQLNKERKIFRTGLLKGCDGNVYATTSTIGKGDTKSSTYWICQGAALVCLS